MHTASRSPPKLRAPSREEQLRGILQYLIPTILGLAISAFAYYYFVASENVWELQVSDQDKLKEVFFSGMPWVVACKAKDGERERGQREGGGGLGG